MGEMQSIKVTAFLASSASSGSLLSVTFEGCPSTSFHSEIFNPQPIALITSKTLCLIFLLFDGMEFLVCFLNTSILFYEGLKVED